MASDEKAAAQKGCDKLSGNGDNDDDDIHLCCGNNVKDKSTSQKAVSMIGEYDEIKPLEESKGESVENDKVYLSHDVESLEETGSVPQSRLEDEDCKDFESDYEYTYEDDHSLESDRSNALHISTAGVRKGTSFDLTSSTEIAPCIGNIEKTN